MVECDFDHIKTSCTALGLLVHLIVFVTITLSVGRIRRF
jgi:hypothetical protein